MSQCPHKSPSGKDCLLPRYPEHFAHSNLYETWSEPGQLINPFLPCEDEFDVEEPKDPLANDCVCPFCKNERCRRVEKTCWLCGGLL